MLRKKTGPKKGKRGTKWHTDKEIIAGLEKALGMRTYAAELIGMTYTGLYKRILKSPKLQEAERRIEEKALDMSEIALAKNIKAGKEASIFFHLKCKGKSRGYVERIEHSGKIEGGDTQINITPQKTFIFRDIKPNGGEQSADGRVVHAAKSPAGDREQCPV